ncbi:MAG: hypothetical protein ACE5GS_16365 [Kiloniellaceae bacterium]
MQDHAYHARATALSMAHGAALARLLHAHGKHAHADRLEAALRECFRIVADELGHHVLAEAVRWVAEETGGARENDSPPPRHH